MHYHVEFDLAAIAILIVCYVYTHFSFDGKKISTQQYKFMLSVILVATILDSVTAYTIDYSQNVPLWLNYVLNCMYYYSAALASYMLPRYVRYMLPDPKKMRLVDQINRAILIAYFIICVTNPATKLIFYFNDNKEFFYGPLHIAVYLLPAYFIFLASSRGIYFRAAITTKQFVAILSFTLIAAVIMTTQFIFFNTYLLTYFGSSLGMFIILYSLETPDFDKLAAAMKELEKAKEEATMSNNAKSSFLANMSHEIRTPINGILGMNEIAMSENKDPQIDEYLMNIQTAGQNLLGIINDILDFSKIESGKLDILPHEYLLSDLLYSVNNLLAPKATEKGLKLIIEASPSIPNKLFGDDLRIRQIIVNTLNNGIKYTEKGTVKLNVDSKHDEDTLSLVIKVSDTGIGISKEDLPKLFNSYQRVDETNTRHIEGTGLGLVITKQLVDLMHGQISVTSEYGVGSEFTVVLPQKVLDDAPIGDYENEKAHPSKKKTGSELISTFQAPMASILIVDDNELNRKVILGLLKNTMMQMDSVDSGFACLEKCKENTYDLILLDHMMPQMDGIETLMHIKGDIDSKNTTTPVVVLTANAITGAKEEYIQKGFDDFLSKPVDSALLYNVLTKYIPEKKYQTKQVVEEVVDPHDELNPTIEKLNTLLNTHLGIKNCGNQKPLYIDAVTHFTADNLEQGLIDSFFNLDWKNYGTIAHGLKSASGTIGATNFSQFAKRMEFACNEERVDIVLAYHDSFLQEYKQLQDKIKELLE